MVSTPVGMIMAPVLVGRGRFIVFFQFQDRDHGLIGPLNAQFWIAVTMVMGQAVEGF